MVCAFSIVAAMLIGVLFKMQILGYEKYQQDVIDNLTVETKEKANRGKIYDSNMNLLATNTTSYRVFISPKDIQYTMYTGVIKKCFNRVRYGSTVSEATSSKREDEVIAEGLSSILGVDYDLIIEKAAKKNRLQILRDRQTSRSARRQRRRSLPLNSLHGGWLNRSRSMIITAE